MEEGFGWEDESSIEGIVALADNAVTNLHLSPPSLFHLLFLTILSGKTYDTNQSVMNIFEYSNIFDLNIYSDIRSY